MAIGLFSWRELVIRYEVARMRRNTDHLLAVIDRHEGIYAEAVERLFKSNDYPGEALLRRYLKGLVKTGAKLGELLHQGEIEAYFTSVVVEPSSWR